MVAGALSRLGVPMDKRSNREATLDTFEHARKVFAVAHVQIPTSQQEHIRLGRLKNADIVEENCKQTRVSSPVHCGGKTKGQFSPITVWVASVFDIWRI